MIHKQSIFPKIFVLALFIISLVACSGSKQENTSPTEIADTLTPTLLATLTVPPPPTATTSTTLAALGDTRTRPADGMTMVYEGAEDDSPITILTGPVADQAALRGLLTRIWDLNLTVISSAENVSFSIQYLQSSSKTLSS